MKSSMTDEKHAKKMIIIEIDEFWQKNSKFWSECSQLFFFELFSPYGHI